MFQEEASLNYLGFPETVLITKRPHNYFIGRRQPEVSLRLIPGLEKAPVGLAASYDLDPLYVMAFLPSGALPSRF